MKNRFGRKKSLAKILNNYPICISQHTERNKTKEEKKRKTGWYGNEGRKLAGDEVRQEIIGQGRKEKKVIFRSDIFNLY